MALELHSVHYDWRPDVEQVVNHLHKLYGPLNIYTYVDHPWPGWDGRSFDVWGKGGLLDPLSREVGRQIRDHLMHLPWGPFIRHTIWRHSLWTSFGGYSEWTANDHSGVYRHLHVTYW